MPIFRFDRELHEYWLDYISHSIKLPSVTQVIDANGLISEQSKSEAAALQGLRIHEAARFLFERRLDWNSVDQRILGCVASLELWLRITGFKAEACEVILYHAILLFAGTYDVKGLLPDGSRWLIDVKSGAQEKWHEYQTGGYMLLEGGYRRRGSLYLQRNGSLARFKEHRDFQDVTKFVSLLNTYRMKEKDL